MNKVIMYSTQVCPYCQMAERLLKSRGVEHIEKVLIDKDPARRQEMMTRTGRRTVPQVYIGDRHVGGYDDLSALDRAGGLTPLLEAAA
ncbi:glutaredoxin 3 [Paraburkholderia sp. LEh10]|uniref:glutaredoxin 3 n=1 Tax=Paraburkholderia sp. LEh10 TaxID=2821353 RepID=UPI001AE6011A|nr:glutaredoxin 3 [Paraburkholderia sp. LEh10]MBP0588841.1 glutaredoxin 3 [Paraburkholderia sp. LEh10]